MFARRDVLKAGVALLVLPALPGCGEMVGPEPIAWERDACEHCRMIISDRPFATELRGGAKKRLYRFDDVGCAVHWARKQGWGEGEIAEFWVMSHDDGKTWLDARTAHYLVGMRSPMNYNFAAVPTAQESSVSYDEMIRRLAAGGSHTDCGPAGATRLANAEVR